ncbi:MAG: hypothetical protein PHY43_07000 [Verrucomicrobiales bacterium]|nr:hypothetical protein [Verrucomicrobiales bacterium]
MKIIFRLALLAVVVAAGVWLWIVIFPGPEKIIRQRLAEIARLASFKADENPLAALGGAQKLAGFCSPDLQVKLAAPVNVEHTFESRQEIVQSVLAARSTFGGTLKVEFVDVLVTLAPDKQSAEADLTARMQSSGSKELNVQEIKFTLKKVDGQWLVTRVETVRTFS